MWQINIEFWQISNCKLEVMKTILLILVSSFISIYAQNKLGNEWITGGGGNRVKFTQSGIFTSDNKFILSYFTKGNSNICDTNGNLILCSDGYNVYDSNANYLDGGDTLIPKDLFVDSLLTEDVKISPVSVAAW